MKDYSAYPPEETESLRKLDKTIEGTISKDDNSNRNGENCGGEKAPSLPKKQRKYIKEWRRRTMKFYKIDDQIVFTDKGLGTGVELTPNTTDGAHEKHVPQITINGAEVRVQVGSVAHPMMGAHYIEFIVIETNTGIHTKWLKPGMEPKASFKLVDGETAVAAYEYCNLHGLWMAKA